MQQLVLKCLEENPLKDFKIRDEWFHDMKNGYSGNSLDTRTLPVLITRPVDPYERLCDEVYEYEGGYDEFRKPHENNAVITFENGDIFRGNVVNGYRNGYGILKFSSKKQWSRCVVN